MWRWWSLLLALLAGCVTQPEGPPPARVPGEVAEVASRVECKLQPQIWPYPPGIPTEYVGGGGPIALIDLVAYDEGEIPGSVVRLEFFEGPPEGGGPLLNRNSTPLHTPTSAVIAWPPLPQPVSEFPYDPALSWKVDDGEPHEFSIRLRHVSIDFIIYSVTGPWYVNPEQVAPIDVGVGTSDIGVVVGAADIDVGVGT